MYKSAFPECRFVWLGDSGQGDVDMGVRMLDEDKEKEGERVSKAAAAAAAATAAAGGGRVGGHSTSNSDGVGGGSSGTAAANADIRRSVIGVYIQDVVLGDGVTPKTSYRVRCEHRKLNVHIVDNYVDVALHMHKAGLLGLESLRRIAYDSVHELAEITLEGFKESKMIRKADKKMAVSRESDDTKRTSTKIKSTSDLILAEDGPDDGQHGASTARSSRVRMMDLDPNQTSYIWDARVAELRYSVGRVNAVLAKTRFAFQKVVTSSLCQHTGGINMAHVKYHDAVLAAKYSLDEALQQAQTEFDNATKQAMLAGFRSSAQLEGAAARGS